MIAVQVAFGLLNGIHGGRENYVYQARAASTLRNIDHSSNNEVEYFLSLFAKPSFIRDRAETLENHHLSLFAGKSITS